MRLFIAINFNSDTRNKLLVLRDELHACSVHGNFSLPSNLHLTLVFLGECDTAQANNAKAAMDAITFAPLSILMDCVGQFKRIDGDIWWAGVREDMPLLRLQRDLMDQLTTMRFALEKRKYSPHITLGRKVITDAIPWPIEPFKEIISSIQLMKSERINGKLMYTVIYEKMANA